ncbi:MAG: TRAP transporter small permease, partial [Deltaproteobacteria bacterium]|nr:TRAP transporter small permease [Deltaproteobacteria bacterium]
VFGFKLNWVNERVCAALVAATVVIVWIGVMDRYMVAIGAVWSEELARYTMIWAALMAVPCCAYRREHISLNLLFDLMPAKGKRIGRVVLDIVGLLFFLFLAYYSVPMVWQGMTQYATIFDMTMEIPFLSVTVSSLLTAAQILLSIIREYAGVKILAPPDAFYTT